MPNGITNKSLTANQTNECTSKVHLKCQSHVFLHIVHINKDIVFAVIIIAFVQQLLHRYGKSLSNLFSLWQIDSHCVLTVLFAAFNMPSFLFIVWCIIQTIILLFSSVGFHIDFIIYYLRICLRVDLYKFILQFKIKSNEKEENQHFCKYSQLPAWSNDCLKQYPKWM